MNRVLAAVGLIGVIALIGLLVFASLSHNARPDPPRKPVPTQPKEDVK